MAVTAAPQIPFPKALARFPTLRQSLLGAADMCMLEARLAWEYEYDGPPSDPDRMQWHTHPQARGQIFHRWAARLMDTLATLGHAGLVDSVECKYCGDRPNEWMEEGQVEAREGDLCSHCVRPLVRVPLTQLALDMLADVLRQDDVPDDDVVTVPQNHVKDLEWIVCKFAREQRFRIHSFQAAEERMWATLEYPNPYGGVVERTLTGAIDAWFLEQDKDGAWHAYVIDYKDTWAIPGRTTISAGGYWQQRFYAWLLMKNNPDVQRVTLREVYVRYRAGESGRDNHREATITRDKLPIIQAQLAVVTESFDRAWEAYEDWRALAGEWDTADAAVQERVRMLARRAAAGEPLTAEELADVGALEPPEHVREQLRVFARRVRALFLPTPGGHCNYCPLPHQCPIVDDVRVHGTIRNPKDAERVAGELAVITRAKKHREQALQGYLEHARSAPVTKPTADETVKLRTYTDKPAGLPLDDKGNPVVPLLQAKGRKAYALVEGTRTTRPDRETIEQAMEDARNGIPVATDDLYRTATSTTMRLVEEKVPTDEARQLSPLVEEALDRALRRLEQIRAVR